MSYLHICKHHIFVYWYINTLGNTHIYIYIVIGTSGMNWRKRDKHYSKSGFQWFPLQHHIIVNLKSCNSQLNYIENPDEQMNVNFIVVIWGDQFLNHRGSEGFSNQDDLAVLIKADEIIPDLSTKKNPMIQCDPRIFEAIVKNRNAEFRQKKHEIHLHSWEVRSGSENAESLILDRSWGPNEVPWGPHWNDHIMHLFSWVPGSYIKRP